LVGLMVGSALATGCASIVVTFVVVAAVKTGFRPGAAGVLVAGISGLAVIARLFLGALANRLVTRPLMWVATMVMLGAMGCGLLAVGTNLHQLAVYALGATIAVGIGWGWSGLFYLGVLESNRGSEARATSVVQVGGAAGWAIGPLVFGAVASSMSFTVVWLGAGCVGALAAIAMLAGSRLVSHSL